MNRTILVTGINGFVGGHLTAALNEAGFGIVGCGIQPEQDSQLQELTEAYIPCDLMDPEQVDRLPWDRIDGVIHLAGLASQADSFARPSFYMHANTAMTIELFESAMRRDVRPKMLVVSSGTVYSRSQAVCTEETPTQASSPYNASKLAVELMADYYRQRGFPVTVARPFNHIGPGQLPGFIVPDFMAQIRHAIETGEPVRTGNLDSKRDYLDARDVVRAYVALISGDTPHSLYNICSGKGVSGTEILGGLLEAAGQPELPHELDPEKIRPSDMPLLIGSNERLVNDTGWHPEIPLQQTLRDAWEDFSSQERQRS